MSEPDYSSWVKPVQWGKRWQLPNGHWLTSWEIELESLDATQLEAVAGAATDPEAGFTPHFTPHGAADLTVKVETVRRASEDDYFGMTYQLFRLIDARLGRIRFLQGSPREWWSIFRSG
jgi:hypothetical protein